MKTCFKCGESKPLDDFYRAQGMHTGERGLGQKPPDREAIPLCAEHHRLYPLSYHRNTKRFWGHHGIDRDREIARLNKLYEETRNG